MTHFSYTSQSLIVQSLKHELSQILGKRFNPFCDIVFCKAEKLTGGLNHEVRRYFTRKGSDDFKVGRIFSESVSFDFP